MSSTSTDPESPELQAGSEPTEQAESQGQPGQQTPPAKKPAFSWSHPTGSGRIDIAVWDKVVQTDNGEKVLYHVTCQRSYRRQQDGGFENTGVFWPTDLLVLAHGLQVVFDRIKEMQRGEPF